MIRYALYAALALISAAIIIGGFHICRVYLKNKKEMSFYAGKNIEVNKDFGKVLVVYYSLSGNTRAIARKIASMTNADIYEIKTKGKMPSGLKIYKEIRKQLKTGKYPEIESKMPDFASYDYIFVGAPV